MKRQRTLFIAIAISLFVGVIGGRFSVTESGDDDLIQQKILLSQLEISIEEAKANMVALNAETDRLRLNFDKKLLNAKKPVVPDSIGDLLYGSYAAVNRCSEMTSFLIEIYKRDSIIVQQLKVRGLK